MPARRVDGGLVVSGRWPYASGAPHATWAALGAVVVDDASPSAEVYLCLVPVSNLRLEDTWHVVGMRGTGSNTWAADNLFVPEHRLLPMAAITDFAPIATLMYRLDEIAADGQPLTYLERAQMRGLSATSPNRVLGAIDVLINVHGAASFTESNPVQRYWRDANTAARHAGLNAMVGFEVLGKALLGVEEPITPLV
ncbi:MAG: hypothetical protein ABWY93_11080 [Mycobacterium sp.]